MMSTRFRLPLGVCLALISGVAFAADPSAHQIYLAVRSGNIAQAQQMVAQVVKDHPTSAKAHFVAAEVQARAGNFGLARAQLAQAQALAPGLPFANARAVAELQQELGVSSGRARVAHRGHSAHLGWALLLIVGVLVVWMIVRRRMAAAAAYGSPYGGGMMPGGMAAPPGGYPPGGYPPGSVPPGYGPGYGPGYAPGGSGLMGSVASGLAIGAGVAAGEAVVGHLLQGNSGGGGGIIPDAGAAPAFDPQANADAGGNNFGLNDPGSWDDGSGGGGGGGGWDSGGGDGGWT